MLLFMAATGWGGTKKSENMKVLHVARTRNSTECHSLLFLLKWPDTKPGLLLKIKAELAWTFFFFFIKPEMVPESSLF